MSRIKSPQPFFSSSRCFRIWIPIVCKEIMKAFSLSKTSWSPIIPWSNQMINRDLVFHRSKGSYRPPCINLKYHQNLKYLKKLSKSSSSNINPLSWCLVDSNIKRCNKNNFPTHSYSEAATLLWWWIKTPSRYKLTRYFEEYWTALNNLASHQIVKKNLES